MGISVRSLVNEIKNFKLQIEKNNNNVDLTTVQRAEYGKSILKSLQDKGITYHSGGNNSYIYTFKNTQVDDTGIIKDIRAQGSFPIDIIVDGNILVIYEPRNIKYLPDNHELNNSEFLNLKKGSEYKFSGKTEACTDFYEKQMMVFNVEGSESSIFQENIISKELQNNIESAKKAGMNGVLSGGFWGMVLGIVFYLLLYIILPILNFLFSFNFHNGIKNLYVIAIFIFIGALIGYSDMYDKVRDKRIGKYRK